jgi:phosphoribosylglycinamide formyltransferase-1
LQKEQTDLVVLAGYMNILKPEVVEAFKGRIINIHPSLIPEFCGEGFYGMRVHEAVIQSGAERTGATVHFVEEGVDTGEIILQEEVAVRPGDSAEMLAMRVLNVEHEILPRAINEWREKGEK